MRLKYMLMFLLPQSFAPTSMEVRYSVHPALMSVLGTTGEKKISRGPVVEKMPLPGFLKRELHQQGKCEPCLFKHQRGGCWYGDGCRYCHLCTPEQVQKKQSRKYYLERALRKEGKLDQAQRGPLYQI